MGDKSKIEWTEATWNPTTGCTKISPGCQHCYAEVVARRLQAMGQKRYRNGFELTLQEDALQMPLRWKRPRRVFVNSMSDLFHEDVPDSFIDRVFSVMGMAPQHTFQVLTKRTRSMAKYLTDRDHRLSRVSFALAGGARTWAPLDWPLPNVWLGTSVENQDYAIKRIPLLLDTPAAVRFLSCEPLLGPIDLGPWIDRIDWVIVGGESGHGARPMHPDWARSLRDQCQAAGVPFFFKQWGEWFVPFDAAITGEPACVVCGCTENDACPGGCYWVDVRDMHERCSACIYEELPAYRAVKFHRVGKKLAGRLLDGREWNEYPEVSVAKV